MTGRGETITDYVRQLAENYGVSERTVWRWVKEARATGEWPEHEDVCLACGEPLPAEATLRRRYCEASCRVWASRQRAQRARR